MCQVQFKAPGTLNTTFHERQVSILSKPCKFPSAVNSGPYLGYCRHNRASLGNGTTIPLSLLSVRPDLKCRAGGQDRCQGLPVPPTHFYAPEERLVLLAGPLPPVVPSALQHIDDVQGRRASDSAGDFDHH